MSEQRSKFKLINFIIY